MSRKRDRDRLHIPKYLPKPVSCVIRILAGIAGLLVSIGALGFGGSLLYDFFSVASTLAHFTTLEDSPGPETFSRMSSTMVISAVFMGIVFLGIIVAVSTNALNSLASRIFKPKQQESSRSDDDTRRGRRLYFSQIQQVTDKTLKENLIAAVKNLNIESVDMGLFYLGKIFERELREFLTEAQAQNTFPVTSQDLARLASMIDCIERNGIDIVREKHHLTFLRQERNARAHGQIPGFEERKRMMEQAPFIGGLFIDCIIAIHKKRIELATTARSSQDGVATEVGP